MVIRIRLRTRQSFADLRLQTALALAAISAPSALVALTMCFWSFAAELGFVSEFYVTRGIFAHWQVWFFAAAVLLASARLLTSYGTANVELANQGNSNFHNANPQFAEE
jgi:NADH:ubiquinone oxidoreductase subunit 4 (subunit M)